MHEHPDLHRGRELTMYFQVEIGSASRPVTERIKSTLALGDIVGARTLYPCGCPLPDIFGP